MKIVTHDGDFHPDEVIAIAILKLVYINIDVIRTRDEETVRNADIRVDVGMKYNPKTGDFDHHQINFNEKRDNGIPYASAGLVWKHFWSKLCDEKEIYGEIDRKIMQTIDANDSGFDLPTLEFESYSLMDLLYAINSKEGNKELEDKNFQHAVDIAKEALENEIKNLNQKIDARRLIKERVRKTNKEYVILEKYAPWKEAAIQETKLKFVIYFTENGKTWYLRAVPIAKNSFKYRRLFPKKWAGLTNQDFVKVTGVKDAVFCHKNLFAAGAKSKQGAIELVELALKS